MYTKWSDGCCPFLAENIFFWASGWKSTSFLEWWVSSEAHRWSSSASGSLKKLLSLVARQLRSNNQQGAGHMGQISKVWIIWESNSLGDCNYNGKLSKLNKSLWTTAQYWWIGHWITPDLTWLDCRIGGFKTPWYFIVPVHKTLFIQCAKITKCGDGGGDGESIYRKEIMRLWQLPAHLPTWLTGIVWKRWKPRNLFFWARYGKILEILKLAVKKVNCDLAQNCARSCKL